MIYFLFFFAGVALGMTTGGKFRPLLYLVYLMALIAALVIDAYVPINTFTVDFVDF